MQEIKTPFCERTPVTHIFRNALHQPTKLLQPSEEKPIGLCCASGVGCINYSGCTFSLMSLETLPMLGNGKSNKTRLRVRRVVDVPLREVSGICLGRGRNGRMFLLAIDDRVAKIAWFPSHAVMKAE